MKNLFKKFGRFETHHRILAFAIILIGTIAFTRLSVQTYNPNPILFNFELHHFDYGLILLLITLNLLLFGNRKYDNLYLILAAVSAGFVIDQYVFIRQSVIENSMQLQIYNSSLPFVLVLAVIATLMALFINSIRKK